MATQDDKRRLILLARRGLLEGETGFRTKLGDMVKGGCTGPGKDYGLDYNEKPYFRTALWEATWKNHEAVIRLLVEKNATIDYADYQGRTPLHEAAYYGYRNLVEFFLEKGHPIDAVDNFAQTPLFRATEGGRDEIVQLLVERKAQINLLDKDSCSVQHMAAFAGEPMMSDWLRYQGCYLNRFSLTEGTPGEPGKMGGPIPAAPAAAAAAAPAASGEEAAKDEAPAAAAPGEAAPAAAKAPSKPSAAAAEPQYRGREAAARAVESQRAEYSDK